MSIDLLFRNARVVDGGGNPWYRAEVAVADGRIVTIGHRLDLKAARVVDCQDAILAPGFVEMHTHSDAMLLAEPRYEPKVFQGVTLELLGQDGLSYAPAVPAVREQLRRHLAGLNGDDARAGWDWTSVASYLDKFERRVSVNVAYLVPHNAVRVGAMGWSAQLPTPAELDRMRGLVAEGMQDGAVGLSTGLTYPPNVWSDTDEMVAMCEVVARYGGIYVTHMRGHGDGLLDPIRESIEICQRAGLPLHISHLKGARLGSARNVEGAIKLIDDARANGLDVTFDAYQYGDGSSMLHSQLPDWMHEGGPESELMQLQSAATRARIREEWQQRPRTWGGLTVASVNTKANRGMEGRTLEVLIAESGKDAVDFICDLLLEENLAVSHVSAGWANEEDMIALLRHPAQMPGSDGLMIGSRVHPRTYGSFARVLQRYVRDQQIFRLEEAIRKFSSLPAQRLGLADRGTIKEGLIADLVVFDEQAVTEQATPESPRQLAQGFSYVAVQGALVLDAGQHTGATPGRAVRYGHRSSLERPA